jgi:hypothetical protein
MIKDKINGYITILPIMRSALLSKVLMELQFSTFRSFMYNTFSNVLGGQGKTVITVASAGIAATLLLNGATYHSTFKIYKPITETTTSKIEEHSYIAKLIREASLIICDEATMMTRYALKAIEKILRKIMRNNLPYGKNVVVLAGDFRQCLPVVKHDNRVNCVPFLPT